MKPRIWQNKTVIPIPKKLDIGKINCIFVIISLKTIICYIYSIQDLHHDIEQFKQIIFNMGNKNSTQNIAIQHDKWKEVGSNPLYDVMRSTSNQQAQLYHFALKEQTDLEHELKTYKKRTIEGENLVRVIGVDIEEGGFGFCGTQKVCKVLTERIPITLAEARKLNPQQGIIVLYNSLLGFRRIYQIDGPVVINDKMIGFTERGQTKVWLNQNFGMNHALSHYHATSTLEGEQQMVSNIAQIVENHLDSSRFNNEQWRAQLYNNRTFGQMLQFITNSNIIHPQQLANNMININLNNLRQNHPNQQSVNHGNLTNLTSLSYNDLNSRPHSLVQPRQTQQPHAQLTNLPNYNVSNGNINPNITKSITMNQNRTTVDRNISQVPQSVNLHSQPVGKANINFSYNRK